MHSIRNAILVAGLVVCGATLFAQEPGSKPAIRLGAPSRLGDPALQQASFKTIVRGLAPLPIEEPRSLRLPNNLLPLDEDRLIWPAPPKVDRLPDFIEPVIARQTDEPPLLQVAHLVDGDSIILLNETGEPERYSRFWARGEALFWWTRGFRLPPLITTASPFDPERTRGALGFGNTSLLYGNDHTNAGASAGARFTFGYQLDPCGCWGVEASFFFLGRKNDNARFSSDQFPVLARPFFNINEGMQDRELTTSPALLPGDVFKSVGNIRVDTASSFLGAEANLRRVISLPHTCWTCDNNLRMTGLIGFRYLNLKESLRITENFVVLQDIPTAPPNVPIFANDRITVFDLFDTRNHFYGGQIGASAEWNRGRWTVETQVKLGIGATFQSVDVDGQQEIAGRNGTQRFPGGLYAVASNIGLHSQTRVGFVPEVAVKLGYNINDNIRVFVGYDFLYWSSVLRPGDQIDPVLDLNQVPNSGAPFPVASQVRPRVTMQTSSFWAQGVSAGILFRY